MVLDVAPQKMIGILGGMGPRASSSLYKRMVDYCHQRYGAVQDTDYPSMFLYSLPLRGFDETGIVDEEMVEQQLIEGVKCLERNGSDYIIIGCNTVHYFFQRLQAAISIPIINMIEETVRVIAEKGYKRVGLLSSETTARHKLYERSLGNVGVTPIYVDRQQQLMLNDVIEHVMGGTQNEEDLRVVQSIAQEMISRGVEAIILACTELPLVLTQKDVLVDLVDTTKLLAKSAIDRAYVSACENSIEY